MCEHGGGGIATEVQRDERQVIPKTTARSGRTAKRIHKTQDPQQQASPQARNQTRDILKAKGSSNPTAKELAKTQDSQQPGSPQSRDQMRDILDAKSSSKYQGNVATIVDTDTWDAQTNVSTISSATTLVDPGAVEAFSRSIMEFQSLGCLWAQLVGRCNNKGRGVHIIERLLKRYAKDLALVSQEMQASKGSDGKLCITAARFARRSRLQVSHKIWEAQIEALNSSTGKDAMDHLSNTGTPDLEVDEDDDEPTDDDLMLEEIEKFLFDQAPIFSLQANIKLLINLSNPTGNGVVHRLSSSWKTFIGNTISSFCEPPLTPGYTRLRYNCRCGHRLYDDFIEVQPGSLTNLENLLTSYFGGYPVTLKPGDFEHRATPEYTSRKKLINGIVSLWNQVFDDRGRDLQLPWIRRRADDMELCHCPPGAASARGDHRFVLLCLPFMRWARKLHQLDSCNLRSDQDFFLSLRKQYAIAQSSRPWKSFGRLRRVLSLDFVKFELFRNEFVDVRQNPSVPDRDDREVAKQNYSYEPLPAQTIPPIGPNLLMHLFQHPDHADVEPVIYRKIPKKLRARLEACPVKGSAVGWGVHFTEGVNWVALFAYGCIGFTCALIFAVAWSTVRGDIQSGFAIGSFMITFVLFCLGIARTEIQLGT